MTQELDFADCSCIGVDFQPCTDATSGHKTGLTPKSSVRNSPKPASESNRACIQENIDRKDSAHSCTGSGGYTSTSYSSESTLSPRTLGSWDIPAGPVAWNDADTTFEHLLHYADLTLTEEEENGVLTDRIIASCASYLTRSPASKCHIVAKLCLDNKNLSDIRIIAHHRFLQYVDLSWNNLKDLSPLGYLPYLMYLDVSHNLLEEVLRFKPPWNLTYVNYSYNEVWQIDDLRDFWSLSYLDLSHNKISKIQGLHSLRYLRYLNLSHNKITRFENLSHTRITDLNLEYNLISKFETGADVGMKTMLNLSSLCLSNNLITDLEFLRGMYHLKKLELQGNKVSNLLELSHMNSLRKLRLLDLTGNPVCEHKPYRNLLLHSLPELKFLDQTEVHMSEKVATYVGLSHSAQAKAAQNNSRMILLDQLNDNPLNLDVIPFDQPSYPLVILVGPLASGRRMLIVKLAELYPDKIFVGKVHTTRDILESDKNLFIKIRREEFHEKIKNGDFFCVSENLGHLYGFSREMLAMAVKRHKICLTFLSLESALTIHSYGIQPYLVLTILTSEKEHERRLKKTFGPVVTLLGAAHIAEREISNSRPNNIKRVQEIIHDIIQEVVFWVEEQHNVCFSEFSAFATNNPVACAQRYRWEEDKGDGYNISHNKQTSHLSTKDNSWYKTIKCLENCSPLICGLQEGFKGSCDLKQDVSIDHSHGSIQNTTISPSSEEEMKEEGSGTCSTSYSAVVPPPLRLDPTSFDDEGSFGEEDDIFADWSSPFIDWDEINIDPVALEESAEELCQNFVSRVLATRSVYQNLHLDNPGLFSHVLVTDDKNEAVKNISEYLQEIWRAVPTRQAFFNIEEDYAYQEMVPKRLEKLKRMIREECSCVKDDRYQEDSFAQINSPRTIITQMKMMGYGDNVERL